MTKYKIEISSNLVKEEEFKIGRLPHRRSAIRGEVLFHMKTNLETYTRQY